MHINLAKDRGNMFLEIDIQLNKIQFDFKDSHIRVLKDYHIQIYEGELLWSINPYSQLLVMYLQWRCRNGNVKIGAIENCLR